MEESHRSIHDSLMIVKRCLKNREVGVSLDPAIYYGKSVGGIERRLAVAAFGPLRGLCRLFSLLHFGGIRRLHLRIHPS